MMGEWGGVVLLLLMASTHAHRFTRLLAYTPIPELREATSRGHFAGPFGSRHSSRKVPPRCLSQLNIAVTQLEYLVTQLDYLVTQLEYLVTQLEYLVSKLKYMVSKLNYLVTQLEQLVSKLNL